MPEPVEVFAVPLGPLQANCFIVVQGEQGLVIDPGDEADVVIQAFTEFGFAPAAVLVTHGHFDHFGGVAPVAAALRHPRVRGRRGRRPDGRRAASAPWPASTSSRSRRRCTIEGEQTLDLPIPVLAIPTPGHSRGSYTFAIGEDELFVGDLLFQGSVGRTDLPGGDMDELLNSVAALVRRFPPDATGAQRPRPGHVARPRARAQPVPVAASATTRSTAGELAARAQGHVRPAAGRGRASATRRRRRGARLRRLRLPPRRHPRVRGDGSVRARRRRGHRHRAQGDVHVHRTRAAAR